MVMAKIILYIEASRKVLIEALSPYSLLPATRKIQFNGLKPNLTIFKDQTKNIHGCVLLLIDVISRL